MARFAGVVVADLPHHVTQRGNRRQRIFFETGDEQVYLDLLSARLRRRGVACPITSTWRHAACGTEEGRPLGQRRRLRGSKAGFVGIARRASETRS